MHLHRKIARLAALTLCLPAVAQVAPDAGPDFSVVLPATAPLNGALNNRSPLDWWTADGNHATENAIVMYNQNTGITSSPKLHTLAGMVFGWPSDLIPINGTIYGIESYQRFFYTVDVGTGICTPIGPKNAWTDVYCLGYDAAGDRMFGVDLKKKQLLRFNRQTGIVTKVGVSTLKGYSMIRGLAYRDSDGKLYAADEWTGKILRIDPTTGVPTVVLTLPKDPYSRIEELSFYNDQLYCSLGLQDATATLIAGQLQKIDLATGVVTNVGPVLDDVSPHSLVINSLPEESAWTKQSGPGTVTFSNAKSLTPTVSFSAPGVYVLALTAFAVSGPVSDTVTVTVN
jgi:hypothetical protein